MPCLTGRLRLMCALSLFALACGLLTGTALQFSPPSSASPDMGDGTEGRDAEELYCSGAQTHPMGESIAATYEVSYEQVMHLYCDGFAFDDILLALETQAQSDVAVETILQMLESGRSWNDIWKELGLVD